MFVNLFGSMTVAWILQAVTNYKQSKHKGERGDDEENFAQSKG